MAVMISIIFAITTTTTNRPAPPPVISCPDNAYLCEIASYFYLLSYWKINLILIHFKTNF